VTLAVGAALLGGALGTLVGCAGPEGPDAAVSDPLERPNRAIFGFNEAVVEPVADAWAFITPEALRVALDKAFYNLSFPVRLVTNLGQAQLRGAGVESLRFVVNSTVGVVGLFDPATRFGLGRYDEDFGQMFGRWGVPGRPYWVLPILGPSNPRDTVGIVMGIAMGVVLLRPLAIPTAASVGAAPVRVVNTIAIADPQLELSREAALDHYVFVRDAYLQRREAQIRNAEHDAVEAEEGPAEDLYELEQEFEEELPGESGGLVSPEGTAPAEPEPAPEEETP
jgi:phospholipid-binding lipoprotein MlaA